MFIIIIQVELARFSLYLTVTSINFNPQKILNSLYFMNVNCEFNKIVISFSLQYHSSRQDARPI